MTRLTLSLAAAGVILAAALPAAAAQPVRAFLNGKPVAFTVAPLVSEGRLLVPARAYLEAMGATVAWDGATNTVTARLDGREVWLAIGSPRAAVDGKPVVLDVPPRIVGGHTLVPLRFLSQGLGAEVRWDSEAAAVYVVTRQPPVSRGGVERDRTPQPTTLEVFDGPLNLRTGPGTDRPILALLPTGATVEVLTAGTEWAQVRLGDGRTGWVAKQYTRPSAPDTRVASIGANVDTVRLVAAARGLLGTPYAWGGNSPATGFDCSGFLRYVFGMVGVNLPRSTADQAAIGTPVRGELQVADIVVFTTYAPGPTHTGMYIGGGRFIHSANETTGVTISAMSESYWAARYLGARRLP